MKRAIYLVVCCTVLMMALWLAWAFMRDRKLWREFDTIKTGATQREVLEKLGKPKRVENCGEFMGPLTKAEMEGCVKEYFYASPFAPLLPQYYVVRFDANKRVISTTPYSSL